MNTEEDFDVLGDYITNIVSIARKVFSEPPKPLNSIMLMIDEKEYEDEIFENVAWFGMKFLFGDNATPETVSENDFKKLNEYMASMGKLIIADKESEEEIKIRIIDL